MAKKKIKKIPLRFMDEVPRIGSGVRRVEVAKVGRKWVSLKYWPGGPTGHTINGKLKLAEFERMKVA